MLVKENHFAVTEATFDLCDIGLTQKPVRYFFTGGVTPRLLMLFCIASSLYVTIANHKTQDSPDRQL